ncbi:MAG: hypothetical protein RLZZ368_1205 [Actinomycetota bacterium]
MKRKVHMGALALAAILVTGACGSDDSSSESSNDSRSPIATQDSTVDDTMTTPSGTDASVETSDVATSDANTGANNETDSTNGSGQPISSTDTSMVTPTPNTGGASGSSGSSTPTAAPTTPPPTTGDGLPTTTQLLDPVGLRIEAEHPDGYNRDLFRHWIDADGDGCDTRKEVLISESLDPVQTGSSCVILSGRWYSIYDNTETTDSSRFDIDHVVALKEAWDSGAWNWTADQRRDFANDLSQSYFLIAVSASSNRSKSDRDPAEWMPTNTSYRCEYVRIWVQVKRAWNLSVDQAENDAIRNTLAAC